MEVGILSMRYAKAIIEYAQEKGLEDRLYQEFLTLSHSFCEQPGLREALDNPVITTKEKLALVCTAADGDGKSTREFVRFITLVLRNRREGYLQFISLMYLDLYRKLKHIGVGKLITAVPVNKETEDRIRSLPASGAYSIGGGSLLDRLRHLVLPLIASVAGHLWYFAYMVRNMLCEETRSEYIVLARAKGTKDSTILFRHCLKNVLPAYISLMAVSVAHILGGTYLVEAVFGYPGIGMLTYESAKTSDYNMLMVLCLLTGVVMIAANTIAELVNARLNPYMAQEEK